MKLLLLTGSNAVGKMTVGQELTKITNLRLNHNHMTIEPIIEIFGYYNSQAVGEMRRIIFENFAKSNFYGMIFTFVWYFEQQSDWDYILNLAKIFEDEGAEIYCVELVADQNTRLARNKTENRLANKASKRDIKVSEGWLRDADNNRCVSRDGEIPFANYMRIDNTDLPADVVAGMIKDRFGL